MGDSGGQCLVINEECRGATGRPDRARLACTREGSHGGREGDKAPSISGETSIVSLRRVASLTETSVGPIVEVCVYSTPLPRPLLNKFTVKRG